MWTYYGSKTNVIDFYPKPKFNRIIEPFAGTARYALKYFENDILLVDKYEVIINIWKWLQECSEDDIKRLPHFIKPNQSLNDLQFDCQPAKDLLGFLIGFGMQRPRKMASEKRMVQRPNHVNFSLKKIEKSLFKIKHWEIVHGSYENISQQQATWFIDPPYEFGGQSYVHGTKKLDFVHLADWCRSREGQVMVCENTKATWMDFKAMTTHKGANGMQKEAIWCNEPMVWDNLQHKIEF